ncbi:MAG: acyl-CoA synthetase [Rhodospirillales bacterium]|nr:acyl-CoA synthetase [Rhodospirillales bacterium]MCW9003250.1 acyl-CoA synthetase [Rhodospirillales bacterium]MCW9039067.1 acyl-CoA synthetase [Rhodospirillales bacterium]
MGSIYDTDLEKNPANYTPISPLTFIERSAAVYPDHESVVHGDRRYTWSETFRRCRRLASALTRRGLGKGDTVAVMLSNTPEMYECHFGVPVTGAVLNTMNTRLDATAIAFILNHGEAKLLITDTEFADTVKEALAKIGRDLPVIDVDDPIADVRGDKLGEKDYEALLAEGDDDFPWIMPADEWDAISLNYTSGTTGNPKGVVYHHRGAYLNAVNNAVGWNLGHHPRYLWTLPMFHCNGWCFPWTLAAIAGTSLCLRKVSAGNIFAAIADEKATHFCGAPIVLNFVINASDAERRNFDHKVEVMTAAAPPPAATLENMQKAGFNVTHVYGLTETYGPATMCAWNPEWNDLPIEKQTVKKGRQGVRYHMLEGLNVIDPETMTPVPADGETMGEVMFKGNIVMKGYLKNPKASAESFAGGWFHSGDLGVMQPDGYIKLKDRSKDIIISGGENISSIEVEDTITRHEAVFAAAVVARPDDKWGETPCAFVELKPGREGTVTEDDIIAFCRENLARFKCPRHVVFTELPKTSTGKVQKFRLRDQAAAL